MLCAKKVNEDSVVRKEYERRRLLLMNTVIDWILRVVELQGRRKQQDERQRTRRRCTVYVVNPWRRSAEIVFSATSVLPFRELDLGNHKVFTRSNYHLHDPSNLRKGYDTQYLRYQVIQRDFALDD